MYPIYKYYGNKLTYNGFYNQNIEDLEETLKRIYPKIKLEDIDKIIDETPMSDIRKEFLKESIKYRKIKILDKAYQKICQFDKNNSG